MTECLIGLDPGPRSSGIALLSMGNQWLGWRTVAVKGKLRVLDSGKLVYSAVEEMLASGDYQPQYACIETFKYFGKGSTNIMLTGQLAFYLAGLLHYAPFWPSQLTAGTRVLTCEPNQWRKQIVGNPAAKDRDTRRVVELRHKELLFELDGKAINATSHVCDALCVAEYALIQIQRAKRLGTSQ